MCKNLSCAPRGTKLGQFFHVRARCRRGALEKLVHLFFFFFNARSVKKCQFCQCLVLPGKDAANPPAPNRWFSHPFMVAATADQHTLTLPSQQQLQTWISRT